MKLDLGAADPGSFRDPTSRVLRDGDRIYRALAPEAEVAQRTLGGLGFFLDAMAAGDIVRTWWADRPAPDGFTAVLEHERVPVVSYPYEWSFSMLQDAALLQLRLTAAAIDAQYVTKDATPYNVQFVGSRPTFIDVGSFEPLRGGEPWYGYRQFCQLFLNPLLLQAWRGLDLQILLRGSLEGISPSTTAALLGRRQRLRRAALAHVTVHARADRRYAADDGAVKDDLAAAGLGPQVVAAQVRNLERAVRSLRWEPAGSTWSDYSDRAHYEGDLGQKERFVEQAVREVRPEQVLDLGANDGHFSTIAADAGAQRVIAVDGDHLVVDRLYQRLRAAGDARVLPLVVDLTDPSPARGWAGVERSSFVERATSDLVLCLAVVHHLALTGTVPFDLIVDLLADLGPRCVIEFPHREDPMVSRLLGRKRSGLFDGYDLEPWERALRRRFEVDRREVLVGGTRTLYAVTRR